MARLDLDRIMADCGCTADVCLQMGDCQRPKSDPWQPPEYNRGREYDGDDFDNGLTPYWIYILPRYLAFFIAGCLLGAAVATLVRWSV